ncbi:hypothetical protein ACJX0J_030857, partial [Zea mays]
AYVCKLLQKFITYEISIQIYKNRKPPSPVLFLEVLKCGNKSKNDRTFIRTQYRVYKLIYVSAYFFGKFKQDLKKPFLFRKKFKYGYIVMYLEFLEDSKTKKLIKKTRKEEIRDNH